MNELIAKLAKQADEGYTGDSADDMGAALVGNDAIKKFAELLLENVLEIVKNNTPDPDPYSERYLEQEYGERIANYIRDDIKYYFGVE